MIVTGINAGKQLKDCFLKNLKRFFFNFIQIPDSSEFDSKVLDLVRRMERLTITFQVLRNGLNQTSFPSVNAFGYRRLKLIDWAIVITSFINSLRFIALIYNGNNTICYFLGDPLYRSKDRIIILTCAAIIIGAMVSFRERILYLEAKGSFEMLSEWKIYRDGFDLLNLRENNLNFKRFRFAIYLISLFIYSIMLVLPIFLSFLFFTLLLTNSWTYKIPELAFFGFLWSISTVFCVTYIANSVLGFAWYVLCALTFHQFRLLDLLASAGFLLNKINDMYTEKYIRSLCSLIIRRLNNFDLVALKLRYIFWCYVFVYGFSGDVYIFLGIIIRIYSGFFANLIVINGIVILSMIGAFGLAFGNYIIELNKLVITLHQLALKNQISPNTMIKVLEIMDRVAGPYNGVKIGDFLTLEKTFFISFIMENISILMLFTVNIGPLI